MPPRHISPQSFDDILSELGDDPAIPDPHGIRKTSSPPRVDTAPKSKGSNLPFVSRSFDLRGLNFTPILLLGGIFLLCGGALFFYFDFTRSDATEEISSLQNQLVTLKDELEFSQSEWASERDALYEAIDEVEVSVHSLNIKPSIQAIQTKPAVIPHEVELRRWRYLGITRMGVTEQAFFHTGKTTRMVQKQDLTLGEWRLTQAEKELAVLTHPKGKSITFNSTPSE